MLLLTGRVVKKGDMYLAHTDLPHELVLIPVHSSQLSNVGEGVLQAIC